jgi:hypothetical protein
MGACLRVASLGPPQGVLNNALWTRALGHRRIVLSSPRASMASMRCVARVARGLFDRCRGLTRPVYGEQSALDGEPDGSILSSQFHWGSARCWKGKRHHDVGRRTFCVHDGIYAGRHCRSASPRPGGRRGVFTGVREKDSGVPTTVRRPRLGCSTKPKIGTALPILDEHGDAIRRGSWSLESEMGEEG